MLRGRWLAPLGICTLSILPVVRADSTSTGVIVASIVAGVLLICVLIGITVFCLHKHGGLTTKKPDTKRRKKKHVVYMENGIHPPYYEKRGNHHKSNGYAKHKMPPPLAPAFVEPVPFPPQPVGPPPAHYATYHGPPPEMLQYAQQNRSGTLSGPPPIVIPYGTVTVRADPRPVVHKANRKREERVEENRRRSPKHRSPERQNGRHQSQEFVVQQSYDGIPVIRPVIYVDDDEYDRKKHRSKSRDIQSRDMRFKKRSKEPSPVGARVTEIKLDSNQDVQPTETVVEIEQPRGRSRTITPPPSRVVRSAERSRASSVTEAVNELRRSVQGHAAADDDDSDSSSSSKAPSFNWAHSHHAEQRAPDPVAGDVMFFPAGTHVEPKRHAEPKPEPSHSQQQDDPYVYTKVIKSSVRDEAPKINRDSPVPASHAVSKAYANAEYEVPVSRSTKGTREEEVNYETEHGRVTGGDYNHIGASMSDRLQNVVESGDKSRFTHYNVGAINFGDEEETGDEIDPSQLRTKRRPETPPADTATDHIYARAIKRPESPPNDIPLISPRESTEVPPLNLRSAVGSPRDQSLSYRPATPPKDFPITPHSSFIAPRPRTPPMDFPMTPKGQRPLTPPFDGQVTSRSVAVDPSTGEPGSFQARQRLIEAHLLKNAGGSNVPATKPKPQTTTPTFTATPKPAAPPVPTVHVTPGVIPPAPPPPPIK